jgi:hypothetical protein
MNLRTVDSEFYHRTATCAGSMTPDMPAAMDLLRLAVEGIAKVSELGPKVFPKNDKPSAPLSHSSPIKKRTGYSHAGRGSANFSGGKLPHTGGRSLHQQTSALVIEETMIRGFEK